MVLVFLVGALLGSHYKDWHYSKIGSPESVINEGSLGDFDNAIKHLYIEGYCKGFPLKTGVYIDNRVGTGRNYIECGLPYIMFMNAENEYMYLGDEVSGKTIGIVRYE
jgi:hypothetical protein